MHGVEVDPPPIAARIVDPRTGYPTRPFVEFMHRMWKRTGGEQDLVTGVDGQRFQTVFPQSYSEGDGGVNMSFGILGSRPAEIINATADFTTTGDQVIICTNTANITITLNPNPDDGEVVKIKRQNGGVLVSGPIDGATSKRIHNRYSAPHLIYTIAAGEWSIV